MSTLSQIDDVKHSLYAPTLWRNRLDKSDYLLCVSLVTRVPQDGLSRGVWLSYITWSLPLGEGREIAREVYDNWIRTETPTGLITKLYVLGYDAALRVSNPYERGWSQIRLRNGKKKTKNKNRRKARHRENKHA